MVRVIRTKNPIVEQPNYLPFGEKKLPDTSVKTGNDMSYGDAKEEKRMDKDDDLKKGDDKDSPLAKPENKPLGIRGRLIRLIRSKK